MISSFLKFRCVLNLRLATILAKTKLIAFVFLSTYTSESRTRPVLHHVLQRGCVGENLTCSVACSQL
jgi:hypothetical protein